MNHFHARRPFQSIVAHMLRVGTLACAAAVPLAACSPHSYKVGAETSSQQFLTDADRTLLAGSGSPDIAVMPVIGSNGLQGYTPAANDALDDAIRAVNRQERVRPYPSTISSLASADQAAEWNTAATQLQASGTVSASSLRRLGATVSSRYLLLPGLASVSSHVNTRVDIFGVTLVRSRWATVHASLQMWDVELGTLIWQSSGSCTLYTEVLLAQPVSVRKTLKELFEAMLLDLIDGRSRSVVTKDLVIPRTTPSGDAAEKHSGTMPHTDTADPAHPTAEAVHP